MRPKRRSSDALLTTGSRCMLHALNIQSLEHESESSNLPGDGDHLVPLDVVRDELCEIFG